jgi:hypothetical protein
MTLLLLHKLRRSDAWLGLDWFRLPDSSSRLTCLNLEIHPSFPPPPPSHPLNLPSDTTAWHDACSAQHPFESVSALCFTSRHQLDAALMRRAPLSSPCQLNNNTALASQSETNSDSFPSIFSTPTFKMPGVRKSSHASTLPLDVPTFTVPTVSS